MRKAVFLDRDGTLIRDRPGYYLRRPQQLKLYKNAPLALRRLSRAGYRLVVLTNQAGVARKILTPATLEKIHRRLRRNLLARGVRLDAIYHCPHAPEQRCRCRKPQTGLLRRAQRRFGFSLAHCYVVGDKASDLEMARRVRLPAVFVLTGHGRAEIRQGRIARSVPKAADILGAAQWILKRSRKPSGSVTDAG
ncbi:MAG: HAD family hydrolase [Elusimicrobia bacterium]|nr:HAD family hydrolase [Elusimicrobiota bacterium]